MPNGTAWDGTVPSQGGTALSLSGLIPIVFALAHLNTWTFNRYSSITMSYTLSSLHAFAKNIVGSIMATFSLLSGKAVDFSKFPSITATFSVQGLKSVSFLRESIITLSTTIDGLMSYVTGGTILYLFGVIPVTFQTDSIRTYLFTRYNLIRFQFPFTGSTSLPVIVPATNLSLVLGGFAVVMTFVLFALVLNQQNSNTKPQRDDRQ
jgi:hypothetical protein